MKGGAGPGLGSGWTRSYWTRACFYQGSLSQETEPEQAEGGAGRSTGRLSHGRNAAARTMDLGLREGSLTVGPDN